MTTYNFVSVYILGVHSNASNFAIISDLGQFSLIITIITNFIHILATLKNP